MAATSEGSQDNKDRRCQRRLRRSGAQRPERQQRARALPRIADQEACGTSGYRNTIRGPRADAKMSRRFMSNQSRQADGDRGPVPFVLCAWPSFADQPSVTSYRVYDDRVGETTRFTYRPYPRVVLASPAEVERRSRCSSATTRSPTVRSRAGRSTRRASTQPRLPARPAARTSWSAPLSSSKRTKKSTAGRGKKLRVAPSGHRRLLERTRSVAARAIRQRKGPFRMVTCSKRRGQRPQKHAG